MYWLKEHTARMRETEARKTRACPQAELENFSARADQRKSYTTHSMVLFFRDIRVRSYADKGTIGIGECSLYHLGRCIIIRKQAILAMILVALYAPTAFAANTVSWGAGQPTTAAGKVTGSGTYTADEGWTASVVSCTQSQPWVERQSPQLARRLLGIGVRLPLILFRQDSMWSFAKLASEKAQ